MEIIQSPFTEPQLDLLRMFSQKIDDNNWKEIKLIITNYFANKAIEEANHIWEKENWDEDKLREILNTHSRTPYKKV